jgi:WD40 repeat protein
VAVPAKRRWPVPVLAAALVLAALVAVPLGVRALRGSPSAPGGRVASTTSQGLTTKTPLKTFTHGGLVRSVAFDPADSNLLASGGDNGQVQLWNVQAGEPSRTIPADKNAVLRVAFSPDGKTLATGHQAGLVELWNAANGAGRPLGDSDKSLIGSPVTYLRFSPDGRWLASGTGHSYVELVALDNSGGNYASCRTCRETGAIAFTTDSKTLLVGADDGSVGLWRWTKRQDQLTQEGSLSGPTGTVAAVAVDSASGVVAAAGGSNPQIWLWRTRNLQTSASPGIIGSPVTLSGETTFVTELAFSPDGKRLAASGGDGKVLVYDVPSPG